MAGQYDTIIVGAGWAATAAARDLSKAGRKILVLEARDRIGGRARTWKDGQTKIDLGCSWIHGYKEGNPAKQFAKEVNVKAHLPQPAEGLIYGPDGPLSSDKAAALRASLSAAQASLKTPHPAPQSSASLASGLFSSSSPLFSSTSASSDPSNTDVTATSPANPTEPTPEATSEAVDKKLAEGLARTLEVPLGLKLENASLRWAGWESTTSFAGSDAAPEGGYQAFLETVLKASGAEIQLNKRVTSIKQASGGEAVEIKTEDGSSYTASTVISTIPLGVLKRLDESFFSPALSGHFTEAVKGTHVGTLEKLLLSYDQAWWPQADKVGSYTFLPTGPVPDDNSSIQDIFNGSTLITANFQAPSLPGANATLLTYLSETPAKLLLKQSEPDVIQGFHDFLVARFKPDSSPAKPKAGELTNWLTDEYSYGATTTPSIVSQKGERSPMDFKELSRPAWSGRLGFAGEHTEMEHRGSVAGAIVSGIREAARVNNLLDLHSH